MDLHNFENVLVLCLIILAFFGGGFLFVWYGLCYTGALKRCGINNKKWTGTIAKINNFRHIEEKYAVRKKEYLETSIEYEVDGVKYNKYIRGLIGNSDKVRIYYKNKNPNYFKLKSDVRNSRRINKTAGFISFIIGIIMIIFGCFILSEIFGS